MRAAGPDEIRVVTRPEKEDVTAHARAVGATVVHGHPVDVAASLQLALDGLAPDDVVLLGFPDTLWEPVDGYCRLLPLLAAGADVALGLFRTPDVLRSDHVVLAEDGSVADIVPKPAAPLDDLIWGIAATTAGVLAGLPPSTEPGAYFATLAPGGRVAATYLSDVWLDIGLPEALARAQQR
jgi:glucose-1-phosphate thymidylyltransferase